MPIRPGFLTQAGQARIIQDLLGDLKHLVFLEADMRTQAGADDAHNRSRVLTAVEQTRQLRDAPSDPPVIVADGPKAEVLLAQAPVQRGQDYAFLFVEMRHEVALPEAEKTKPHLASVFRIPQ